MAWADGRVAEGTGLQNPWSNIPRRFESGFALYMSVAQLAELWSPKPAVGGSIPSRHVYAPMAELADAPDLGSGAFSGVRVRLPLGALDK